MTLSLSNKLLLGGGTLGLASIIGGAIYLENFVLAFACLLVPILVLCFFYYKLLFELLVFLTPISLNLIDLDLGNSIGLIVPSEPILAGMTLFTLLKLLKGDWKISKELSHPLSLSILFYIAWLITTSITSSMPLVSFKFVIARLWYIIPVMGFGFIYFKKPERLVRFIWLFIIGLSLVVIYTLIRHAGYGFGYEEGHWIMTPFFRDHTGYGATLALVFPLLVSMLFLKRYQSGQRFLIISILVLITLGLIMSYTRAAWLSLIAAGISYFLIKFKISWKLVALGAITVVLAIVLNWDQILIRMGKNNTDSSEDFAEHVESMSNISTDASNLERLNRWDCAVSMFKERPLFGFGPGTYTDQYAPFQRAENLTVISTNFGEVGNAHSEYLGALAEYGLVGLLSVLFWIFCMFYYSIRCYHRMPDGEPRILLLGVIMGLITYFTHGVLNNYLDIDKIAVPMWSFMAFIVVLDQKIPQKN